MPGAVPQGVFNSVSKLISPKVVSIEWPEPVFRNGESLEYQLNRYSRSLRLRRQKFKSKLEHDKTSLGDLSGPEVGESLLNKTQIVYFGTEISI